MPQPDGAGWKKEVDEWSPVMTSQVPAPQAIIHLDKCGCQTIDTSTRVPKIWLELHRALFLLWQWLILWNTYGYNDTLQIEYDDSDSDGQ